MHLKSRRSTKLKDFFRNRGKKFWVPVFTLGVALLGFGIFMSVRALTPIGTTVTISVKATRYGYNAGDNYPIYYGVNPSVSYKPWMTHRYSISSVSTDAMCLQASNSDPSGSTEVETVDSDTLKQIMLVTNDTVPNNPYYDAFANTHDWESITASITNLMTNDTNLSYGGTCNNPASDPRASYDANCSDQYEKTKYSDYYWGCSNYYYNCDRSLSNSRVDLRDAIFAVGHMMASIAYYEDDYALSSSDISTLNSLKSTIQSWFSGKSVEEWETFTAKVSYDKQTVGWLEYQGAPKGYVRIYKADTNGNPLSGATFTIGSTSKTTGSDGYTGWFEVDLGTVTYYETGTPSGYVGYSSAQTCSVSGRGDEVTCTAQRNRKLGTGYVKIIKTDSESSALVRGSAKLEGAVFCVYDSSHNCDNPNTTLTIGSDGTKTSGKLYEGTYTVKEKTAPTGYRLSSATQTVTISTSDNDATKTVTFADDIIKGGVSITKQYASYGQPNRVLTGGVTFNIVNDADSNITYTLTTNSTTGVGSVSGLIYGNYTATEVRSAANSAFDLATFKFSITTNGQTATPTGGSTIVNTMPDHPSLSTFARNANSSADARNTEIEISASANVKDYITCSGLDPNHDYKLEGELWDKAANTQIKTASGANVTGGLTFTADDSGNCPSGLDMEFLSFDSYDYRGKTLGIKQYLSKANNGTYIPVGAHNTGLDDTNEQVTVKNIEVVTVAHSQRSLNNTELAAGHVTVVDTVRVTGLANGLTYKIRGELKNASGAAVSLYNGDTGDNTKKTDTYTMTAATGATVEIPMNLELDSSSYIGQNIIVYESVLSSNGSEELASHKSLTDTDQTVSVLTPAIGTVATNNRGGETPKLLEVGTQTVKDTVAYTGLVNGDLYRLEGQLVRVDTGETVAEDRADFHATGENGETTVTFRNINTAELIGLDLVVYERLYYGNNKIAEHVENVTDQIVTVKVPTVGTSAVDNADGDKLLEVDEGIKIKDTVTYDGLVEGDKYTLVMKVLKQSEPDPDHPIATGILENWEASGVSGHIDVVSAAFDTTTLHDADLKGLDLVVYEYLYYGSILIGSHENPSKDENPQIVTVKTPTIKTSAADHKNGTQKLDIGNTTVTDTVTFTDLVPGKPYTLSGTLMNKTTGEPAVDHNGTPIATTATFTPEVANGTTTLTFGIFDTTYFFDYYAEHQQEFVVFEKLYKTSVEIARHEDLTDEAQLTQLTRPQIATNATYKANGSNLLGVGDVTMKDYVDYEGLVEGDWYMIVGAMIDPETGEILEIDDEFVRNTKTFKADTDGKGTVALEINLNTIPFQGRKFIVYERLYRSSDKHGDDRLLAAHEEDLDEGNQTIAVKVATIGTTASNKATGENVLAHENGQVIKDVIAYDGLIMDEEYTLYGYLWDKTENKPLLNADGNRIESFAPFTTPTKKDFGTIEVEFPVDAYDLPGHEIVVFEYLFMGNRDAVPTTDDGTPDTEQAFVKHENPDDPAQTVKVAMRVGTTAADEYDGDQIIGVGLARVIDNLAYEGADYGKTYKAKGWLVYQDTGEPAQGVVITCTTPDPEPEPTPDAPDDTETEPGDESEESDEELEPTPECVRSHENIEAERIFVVGSEDFEETSGAVPITFEFDSRELIGKKLVVYEELYLIHDDGTEELVAEHKDLNDEGQTIVVATPEIHTVATDKADGDKELLDDVDVIVLDKVEYTGLIPGTTYTLYGTLVNKKTGEPIGDDVFVFYTFTATRDAGAEELEFAFNTANMSGQELVAFEELYIDEILDEEDKIAEHKDLNDENQTVWVKVPPVPDTGLFTRLFDSAKSASFYFIIGGGAALAAGAWGYCRLRSRRRIKF